MQIKRGIPVSPGVAISRAVVVDAEDQPVPRRTVLPAQVTAELQRLNEALVAASRDVEKLCEQATATVGEELAKIFGFHLGMLRDKKMSAQFKQMIDAEHVTAEYAVYVVMRRLATTFRQQDNHYFRERVKDIWDLERRVLGYLIGHTQADLSHLTHEAVVIAHDLTPSQTASLDTKKIKALATDAGGRTSHTAILAHALGIPAIVGLEDITSVVNTGDSVIIDGNRGLVIVDPDAEMLMKYRQSQRRFKAFETTLDELSQLPAETKDGTKITLEGNIEFPSEIRAALEKGATGIGLYRTEFLYLASETQPTEEQHFQAYQEAIEALDGQPLTIRTLDLGADKISPWETEDQAERNPFLGCRSIRLCLQNLPLFKTQLRAILRASVQGPMRIMFPMISGVMELRQAKMIVNDVMEDLDELGVPYREDIPIGAMIEVPSAAIQAATLSHEVDFMSIGTNDLIQYTLAVDRGNERIASLYTGAHPAVLQLVRNVIQAAGRTEIDVSLCGEMGGQPEFIMPLIGMGLRHFSITPPAIPEVKKIVRSVSIDHCKRVARKASGFDSDREITHYLQEEIRKIIPEVFDGTGLEY